MSPDPLPPLEGNPLLEQRLRLGALTRDDADRQRLVRRYAYGIPTDEVLDAIAAVSPTGVVELGAGTGYWARLLHDRGVDVVAVDAFPSAQGDNRFVDRVEPWYPVLAGDAVAVAADADAERTLVIVWPTWHEAWAGDAAAAYHAAGGHTVVYVGEGPGGRTGDPTLHARLGIHGPCLACTLAVAEAPCVCGIEVLWRRERIIAVPRWGDADDVCGIYRRSEQPGRADALGRRLRRLRRKG